MTKCPINPGGCPLDLDKEFAALERRLDERAAALAKALELQQLETARRLEELNHAHSRALEAQAKTVSRETFDIQLAAIMKRLDDNSRTSLVLAAMILTIVGWMLFQ